MRNLGRLCVVILAIVAAPCPVLAQQGTVTGVTLSPGAAKAGEKVTATATGSAGPCGAVHIDWGDGAAITYPTERLPVSQAHVYQAGGTFNVRAQGMGNCTGEARTQIVVTAPPAPPRLTAIALSSASIAPRSAVGITLQGTGACSLTLDFGDGNTQEVRAALPTTVRHTYALQGQYSIVATPAPPCAERRTAVLDVGVAQQRIAGIRVDIPAGVGVTERAFTILGSGRCSYSIDFGDGNSETREASLPDVVRHNYPAEGRYTAVVTGRPPCSGSHQTTVERARDLRGSITGITVSPQVARVGERITVDIAGTGTCKIVADFDDGEARTLSERLPHRLTYRYNRPGNYQVVVWTDEPCAGSGDALIRVRRRE